jgi:hypothetical protein
MMPDAKGSEDQDRLAPSQLNEEDHAEFAIRGWQSQLHAIPKRSSLRSLLFASEKVLNGHPFRFELFAGRKRHFFSCIARPSQILNEGRVIEQRRRSAPPPVAH